MKTLVSAAMFAALSSSVVAETVIYIGGTEYDINEIANNTDTLTFNDLESINTKDIGEALRGTSSVEVTSNGGPGQFVRGDLVRCVSEDGREVARGLINYNADEASKLIKVPSNQIPDLLGYGGDPEMIHSDNLVRV